MEKLRTLKLRLIPFQVFVAGLLLAPAGAFAETNRPILSLGNDALRGGPISIRLRSDKDEVKGTVSVKNGVAYVQKEGSSAASYAVLGRLSALVGQDLFDDTTGVPSRSDVNFLSSASDKCPHDIETSLFGAQINQLTLAHYPAAFREIFAAGSSQLSPAGRSYPISHQSRFYTDPGSSDSASSGHITTTSYNIAGSSLGSRTTGFTCTVDDGIATFQLEGLGSWAGKGNIVSTNALGSPSGTFYFADSLGGLATWSSTLLADGAKSVSYLTSTPKIGGLYYTSHADDQQRELMLGEYTASTQVLSLYGVSGWSSGPVKGAKQADITLSFGDDLSGTIKWAGATVSYPIKGYLTDTGGTFDINITTSDRNHPREFAHFYFTSAGLGLSGGGSTAGGGSMYFNEEGQSFPGCLLMAYFATNTSSYAVRISANEDEAYQHRIESPTGTESGKEPFQFADGTTPTDTFGKSSGPVEALYPGVPACESGMVLYTAKEEKADSNKHSKCYVPVCGTDDAIACALGRLKVYYEYDAGGWSETNEASTEMVYFDNKALVAKSEKVKAYSFPSPVYAPYNGQDISSKCDNDQDTKKGTNILYPVDGCGPAVQTQRITQAANPIVLEDNGAYLSAFANFKDADDKVYEANVTACYKTSHLTMDYNKSQGIYSMLVENDTFNTGKRKVMAVRTDLYIPSLPGYEKLDWVPRSNTIELARIIHTWETDPFFITTITHKDPPNPPNNFEPPENFFCPVPVYGTSSGGGSVGGGSGLVAFCACVLDPENDWQDCANEADDEFWGSVEAMTGGFICFASYYHYEWTPGSVSDSVYCNNDGGCYTYDDEEVIPATCPDGWNESTNNWGTTCSNRAVLQGCLGDECKAVPDANLPFDSLHYLALVNKGQIGKINPYETPDGTVMKTTAFAVTVDTDSAPIETTITFTNASSGTTMEPKPFTTAKDPTNVANRGYSFFADIPGASDLFEFLPLAASTTNGGLCGPIIPPKTTCKFRVRVNARHADNSAPVGVITSQFFLRFTATTAAGVQSNPLFSLLGMGLYYKSGAGTLTVKIDNELVETVDMARAGYDETKPTKISPQFYYNLDGEEYNISPFISSSFTSEALSKEPNRAGGLIAKHGSNDPITVDFNLVDFQNPSSVLFTTAVTVNVAGSTPGLDNGYASQPLQTDSGGGGNVYQGNYPWANRLDMGLPAPGTTVRLSFHNVGTDWLNFVAPGNTSTACGNFYSRFIYADKIATPDDFLDADKNVTFPDLEFVSEYGTFTNGSTSGAECGSKLSFLPSYWYPKPACTISHRYIGDNTKTGLQTGYAVYAYLYQGSCVQLGIPFYYHENLKELIVGEVAPDRAGGAGGPSYYGNGEVASDTSAVYQYVDGKTRLLPEVYGIYGEGASRTSPQPIGDYVRMFTSNWNYVVPAYESADMRYGWGLHKRTAMVGNFGTPPEGTKIYAKVGAVEGQIVGTPMRGVIVGERTVHINHFTEMKFGFRGQDEPNVLPENADYTLHMPLGTQQQLRPVVYRSWHANPTGYGWIGGPDNYDEEVTWSLEGNDGDSRVALNTATGLVTAISVGYEYVQMNREIDPGNFQFFTYRRVTVDPATPNPAADLWEANVASSNTAEASAKDGSGKVLVVGSLAEANCVESTCKTGILLKRYNANGTLDTSFGSSGFANTTGFGDVFGATDVRASAVAVQSDGKIIVAGTYIPDAGIDGAVPKLVGFVVRFSASGTLDTTFNGNTGIAKIRPRFDGDTRLGGIAIGSSNEIVVASSASKPNVFATPSTAAITFLNANGTIATAGTKLLNADGDFSSEYNLAVEVHSISGVQYATVAGYSVVNSDALGGRRYGLMMARYRLSDGAMDPTFGNSGLVLSYLGGFSIAQSILFVNGKYLVGGAVSGASGWDFMVARYNADGSLDTSFGTDGFTTTDFGNDSQIYGLAWNSTTSQIVAVGSYLRNGALASAGATYDSSGTLVSSGISASGSGDSIAHSVTVSGTGTIVTVGTTDGQPSISTGVPSDTADGATRSLSSNLPFTPLGWAVNPNYGVGGMAYVGRRAKLDPGDYGQAKRAAQFEDGSIALLSMPNSGLSSYPLEFRVSKVNSKGALDRTFGVNGHAVYQHTTTTGGFRLLPEGLTVDRDGNVYVAGAYYEINRGSPGAFFVVKFTSDGIVDGSFGTSGFATYRSFGNSVNGFPRNRGYDTESVNGILFVRGSGNSSTDRVVVYGHPYTFLKPDGTLYNSQQHYLSVLRILTNGMVDTAFASGTATPGLLLFPATSLLQGGLDHVQAAQATSDGSVLLMLNNGYYSSNAFVKITSAGILDASWGDGGQKTFDEFARPVTFNLDGSGRIVVAGIAVNNSGQYYEAPAVARYHADGTLDDSFGGDYAAGDYAKCGNGSVEHTEDCDDGNTADGDGCNHLCKTEAACGDGVIASCGEECDNGENNGVFTGTGNDCNTDCTIRSVCGNGVKEKGEECDDGNLDNDDGCNESCYNETTCGNGKIECGEQCDDGNNDDGDGCTSYCYIESSCGDGVVPLDKNGSPCNEACDDGENNDWGNSCNPWCELEQTPGQQDYQSGNYCAMDYCPDMDYGPNPPACGFQGGTPPKGIVFTPSYYEANAFTFDIYDLAVLPDGSIATLGLRSHRSGMIYDSELIVRHLTAGGVIDDNFGYAPMEQSLTLNVTCNNDEPLRMFAGTDRLVVLSNLNTRGLESTTLVEITPNPTGANISKLASQCPEFGDYAPEDVPGNEECFGSVYVATGNQVRNLAHFSEQSYNGGYTRELDNFSVGEDPKANGTVAYGDLNGDHYSDIVVATGAGEITQVRVYDGKTKSVMAEPASLGVITPFEATYKGGAQLAIVDTNGDGRKDLVVATGGRHSPEIVVYSGQDGSELLRLNPFATITEYDGYGGPVAVSGGRLGIGTHERLVVAGAGAGAPPIVVTLDVPNCTGGTCEPNAISSFTARAEGYTSGLWLAVGRFDASYIEPVGKLPERNCGNGEVDFSEQCDDGGYEGVSVWDGGDDECDSSCTWYQAWMHDYPECGNNRVDPGEECDDGNNFEGDGCDNCGKEGLACLGEDTILVGSNYGRNVTRHQANGTQVQELFAFSSDYTAGVRVAAGRLKGNAGTADRQDEMIFASGPGAAPVVEIRNYNGNYATDDKGYGGVVLAFPTTMKGGLSVTVGIDHCLNNKGFAYWDYDQNMCLEAACGNGVIDPGEVCDEGASNGCGSWCPSSCDPDIQDTNCGGYGGYGGPNT